MAQSINSKVDIVMDGISFHGLDIYGKIMVGDKGFEFYNDRNVEDFIQIPWKEINYVIASVMLKGKKIPRFAIETKSNGTYSFSAKNPIELLKAMRQYIPSERMVRSLTFFQVLKRSIKQLFHKK